MQPARILEAFHQPDTAFALGVFCHCRARFRVIPCGGHLRLYLFVCHISPCSGAGRVLLGLYRLDQTLVGRPHWPNSSVSSLIVRLIVLIAFILQRIKHNSCQPHQLSQTIYHNMRSDQAGIGKEASKDMSALVICDVGTIIVPSNLQTCESDCQT